MAKTNFRPMDQTSLWKLTKEEAVPDIRWELPDLSVEGRYAIDTESTGLRIYGEDVPIGLSVSTEDFQYSWYIPWGHKSGFNFDLDKVQQWAKDNLRDKDLDFLNFKNDHAMLLKVGIDLEEQGNRVHEVMHCPALLYSNRQDYDLNSLALEELGKNKVELDGDFERFPMQERNSGAVWWYACYDAMLTAELSANYRPRIAQGALQAVLDLEDGLLYAVSAMERAGAILDVDRLAAWRRMAHNRYIKAVLDLYKLVGARIEPTKPSDMAKLFKILNIEYDYTPSGQPSFTNEFISSYLSIEPVRIAYEARQIKSLETKFLIKYDNAVNHSTSKIRYALNQLKASNEEGSTNGTVTGRFSSSGGGKYIGGINIQQVFDDEKQGKIAAIRDFPIRDLFVPAENKFWLSADAMQIEFRLFAHYVEAILRSKRLTDAYRKNPKVDFHNFVAENIMHRPRKLTKNLNFGKIYGLGIDKLADIYLKIPVEEAKLIDEHYNREFPEAKQLLYKTIDIAKSRDTGDPENRGWVRTMLGRKRQYTNRDMKYNAKTKKSDIPYYSALNAVIQGTAADIMKIKIKELYDTRKETGLLMRFTVHDEVDGDVPDIVSAWKVKQILDRPAFPQLKVPILWEVGMGKTWASVKNIEKECACN